MSKDDKIEKAKALCEICLLNFSDEVFNELDGEVSITDSTGRALLCQRLRTSKNCIIINRLEQARQLTKEFPTPHVYTDYTHYSEKNKEHLDKGEPLEPQDYPRCYVEPKYKEIKSWFEKLEKVLGEDIKKETSK